MRSIVAVLLVGLVYGQAPASEIAFSAGLSHDFSTTVTEQNVVFDKVFTNIGAGYDSSSGVFTCPQSGIYLFQFHMLADTGSAGWLELYQNAYYVASVYSHHSSDYAAAGNSVILKVTKGDNILIKTVSNQYGDNTDLYGRDDEVYCTFSGYLLAPIDSEIPVGK